MRPSALSAAEREARAIIEGWDSDVVIALTPFRPHLLQIAPASSMSVLFAEEDLTVLSHVGVPPPSRGARIPWEFEQRALRRRRPEADVVVVIAPTERTWAKRTYPTSDVAVLLHAVDLDFWSAPVEAATDCTEVFAIGEFAQPRNASGLLDVAKRSPRVPTDRP